MNGVITMQSSKTAWIGSLEWSYSGSSVTVTMYTGKTDGYPSSSTSGANFSATITVGGSSRSFSYQQQEIDMWVGSVTVPVSGSTVTISGRVDAPYGVSMYGYPLTGSETVTLKTEPEKPKVEPSKVALSTDRVQMGNKVLISIERDSQDCVHKLLCYQYDKLLQEIAEDVKSGFTWTVSDLSDMCNNALELDAAIVCLTYLDGQYLGDTYVELTMTVPDATTPSVSGGEMTLGQTWDVLCTRNAKNFTQKLEMEFYGTTVQIAEGRIDSAKWTPGYDLATLIPTLTYGTGTLKCTTMNGTAVVGTGTATVRLHVPDNEVTRPKFAEDGLKLSPVSSLDGDFAGLYIRGKTGLEARMEASSQYSTVRSYSISVGSTTAEGNPAVIDLLVSEGDVKVSATVTDARGYSSTVTTYISVLPYRNPKVVPYSGYDEVICERAMANGELSSQGTYLAIRAGRSFSSLMPQGVEKNSCVLRYRWKSSNAQNYGSWNTLLAADSGEDEISVLIGNVVSSLQISYMVQIQAEDILGGTHEITFQIMTEAVSFVLYDGEDGAGFGKYPEAPHVVDIASHMTLMVRGGLEVTGTKWTDLYLSDVRESVENVGRIPINGCHYQVWGGNHVYIAFNCSFEYTQWKTLVNSLPIPDEYRPSRTCYALCPVNDGDLALVSVNKYGEIWVEWVKKLSGEAGPVTVSWIDGYIDYWI